MAFNQGQSSATSGMVANSESRNGDRSPIATHTADVDGSAPAALLSDGDRGSIDRLEDKIAALVATGLAKDRARAVRLLPERNKVEALSGAGFDAAEIAVLLERRGEAGLLVPLRIAVRSSLFELLVGLAIAVTAVVAGGAGGEIVAALAGVLIASSTAANYAAERRAEELTVEHQSELLVMGRQLLNVHSQVRTALLYPDLPPVAAAIMDNVRQNIFFAVDQVREQLPIGRLQIDIEGTRDIVDRALDAASERFREAEEAGEPLSSEDVARIIKEEVGKAVEPMQQGSAGLLSQSGREARYTAAVVHVQAPAFEAPLAAWLTFLREVVMHLVAVPQIAEEARAQSIPLTALGNVMRGKTGGSLPKFVGVRGLAALLERALQDSDCCVVRPREAGSFRGIAFRHAVPAHLRIVTASGEPDLRAGEGQDAGGGPAWAIGASDDWNLREPDREWAVEHWAHFLQAAVTAMMSKIDGERPALSLQNVGHGLRALSDIEMPRISGLSKLRPFLQLALTNTEYCVVDRGVGELVVTTRVDADQYGRRLSDMALVDGVPRILGVGPESHAPEEYRKLLRESVPPLHLPQPAMPFVLPVLASNSPQDVPFDDLIEDLAADVSNEVAPRLSSAIIFLINTGILGMDETRRVSLVVAGRPDELIERITAELGRQVKERLGDVDVDVLRRLMDDGGLGSAAGVTAG